MTFPLPFARGFLLIGAIFLFEATPGVPARSQDFGNPVNPINPANTGPITPGSLNYQKAPVGTILDLYEQLSGKHLIRDNQMDNVPSISLNATGLSKPDTINMIQAVLLLNGVTLIPIDANNIKVVTVGLNKNPKSEGVPLYANAADLPSTDQVVSYYMPLNYINPIEASQIFTQVAPVHQYGGYVPAPSAQAVVITENVSIVRQLIALKELIDAPSARVTSEWVQLNRADSDTVATLLNQMLGQNPTTGAPVAPPGPGGAVLIPARVGNDQPLSNEKNLITGSAQIISDPRSNKLLIVTRPVNLPFLEQMIGQLDQSDIFLVPQRRPLRFVTAQNILPALENALAVGKDELAQAQKDQQTAQTTAPGARPGGAAAPAGGGGGGGGGGAGGSVAAITPQLTTPQENDVPNVVTIGKTKLMADNRSNSIIVFGSQDVVARVFDMIDQLDRRPLQVYLATVIGQLTVKQGEEFGIDILQKFQRVGQGGLSTSNVNSSAGTTAAANLPEPASLTSSMGFPLLSGLNLYGAIGSTLDAYVRALETTDRFKIIERPSVYTTNNKLAVIASGSQVPVPESTVTGAAGTDSTLTTSSTIAYEDVLLQLDIIPLINANHDVTLQIRQTDNTLGNNIAISGNEVPTINTQEINTEVTIPDKSTVVIGGLISDTTTRDTSGVPLLSDIPILGYLFKDTTKSKERDELIIMIQPTVVETDADQIAVDEAERRRTILGVEAEEAATGATETLPQPALAPQPDIRPTSYNSKTGYSTRTTITIPASSSTGPNVGNGQMPGYPTSPKALPVSP